MRKMCDFKGVLFYEECPLLHFEYSKGILTQTKVIEENRRLLPTTLLERGVSQEVLDAFFDRRVPPLEQQSFTDFCNKNRIPTSILDGIYSLTNGRWVDDDYWVQPEGDTATWSDVSGYNN